MPCFECVSEFRSVAGASGWSDAGEGVSEEERSRCWATSKKLPLRALSPRSLYSSDPSSDLVDREVLLTGEELPDPRIVCVVSSLNSTSRSASPFLHKKEGQCKPVSKLSEYVHRARNTDQAAPSTTRRIWGFSKNPSAQVDRQIFATTGPDSL